MPNLRDDIPISIWQGVGYLSTSSFWIVFLYQWPLFVDNLLSIFSIIIFQKKKDLRFPFRGGPRYIFDHSPCLQPHMLVNYSIIFVLILMPKIFVSWRLIVQRIFQRFLPSRLCFFMEEASAKSEKRIVSSTNWRWLMLKPSYQFENLLSALRILLLSVGRPLPWWKEEGTVDLLVGDHEWHKSSLSNFHWWWWRSLWMRCILLSTFTILSQSLLPQECFRGKSNQPCQRPFPCQVWWLHVFVSFFSIHLWVCFPWGIHREFVAPQKNLIVARFLWRGEPF